MVRPDTYLSLRQMEMIWTVLSCGSMTKAAEELGVSQPAISRTVRHAEDRSGLCLFLRRGGRLIPTPEASELRREIERVFMNVDRVQRLTQALRQGWGRVVRVGSLPTLAAALLGAAVPAALREQPRLKLVCKSNDMARVEDCVRGGDFDLGLVYCVRHGEDLESLPVADACLVCIMAPDHPLAARPLIDPRDLAALPLISVGRLTPPAAQLDRAFERAGLERHVTVQTGDSRLAARLVDNGDGVAIVDPFFLGPEFGHLAMQPLRPRIAIQAQVIHRRNQVLSRAERTLIARIGAEGATWQRGFEARLGRIPEEPAEAPVMRVAGPEGAAGGVPRRGPRGPAPAGGQSAAGRP